MIPKLIQRHGAQHLAVQEADAAPPHVLELLPESVARENVVFPLRLDGETLFAAVTPRPGDPPARQAFRTPRGRVKG